MQKPNLELLLEKVEGGRAGDRWPTDVSDAVTAALFGPDWTLADWGPVRDALNGSVDAALALAEKVLPGWQCSMIDRWGEKDLAYASLRKLGEPGPFNSDAATIPLALCAAILRALIARTPDA